MKLNGQITMLLSEDGMTLEIKDKASAKTFLRAKLTASQVLQAFGRLSNTPIEELHIYNLERLGKSMVMVDMAIALPDEARDYGFRNTVAGAAAMNVCPKGWEPDQHFGSQDSFFQRDGKTWARTTIRCWLAEGEHPPLFEDMPGVVEFKNLRWLTKT